MEKDKNRFGKVIMGTSIKIIIARHQEQEVTRNRKPAAETSYQEIADY